MTRRISLLATALVALALPALAPGAIRITAVHVDDGDDVRVTVVTAKPRSRPPVVKENGHRVAGLTAENLGAGKSVVLAIDRSQSMKGKPLADASAGARAFVRAKAPADRIAIVAVGHRALQLSRFNSATIDADTTLRSIDTDAVAGTALYDAVVMASEALKDEPHSGRVLILLTDGQEVSSKASLQDAIDAARAAHVTVHPIAIESAAFRPAPLRRLAAETDGRYHAAASSAQLGAIYAAIAAELKRTWQIQYLTNPGSGQRTITASAPGEGKAKRTYTATGADDGGGGSLLPSAFYTSAAGTLLFSLFVAGLVLAAAYAVFVAGRNHWVKDRVAPHVKTARVRATKQEERERLAAAAELFRVTERSLGHTRAWGAAAAEARAGEHAAPHGRAALHVRRRGAGRRPGLRVPRPAGDPHPRRSWRWAARSPSSSST